VSDERCINEGGKTPCRGPVEWRTTPDRTDGKPFLRCEAHFEERMAEVERNLEYQSPARPAWFDEANIGERWEDDY
jgi:hypothetical protein